MAEAAQTKGRRGRRASPWVLAGAAAIVVLAIAAVVIGLNLASSDSTTTSAGTTPSTTTAANALPEAADVRKLYGGIEQHGNQLGDPNAPVAMITYVDLQCPYCAQFEAEAMPALIRKYVRTGKVLLETRPIAALGPDSQQARLAMVAAGLQGKFFDLGQLLYANQGAENSGWLTDKLLRRAAASIDGLDSTQFFQDMKSSTAARQGGVFDDQARQAAIAVTPTIYVGKNGGRLRPVAPAFPGDDATIARAIEQAMS